MKTTPNYKRLILNFIFKSTFFLIIVFVVHLAILFALKKPLFDHLIILAYTVNLVLAILIYISLLFFSKRSNDYLGYIFMYGSLFKFTVFFIFFFPIYNKTLGNSKQEFLTFFLPYAACLIIEIKSLISLLNSVEKRE